MVSVAAVDWWLLATHQLAVGLDQLLRDPATLLIVFVLSVASAAFHECGHATACRYGGARPGKIGAGIYLVWPSFFTNVTDSYRLSRAARLRTDLGGLYFNLIFILGMAVLYEATRPRSCSWSSPSPTWRCSSSCSRSSASTATSSSATSSASPTCSPG